MILVSISAKKLLIPPFTKVFLAICLLLVVTGGTNRAFAQSPYELSWQKELPIGLLAIGLANSGTLLQSNTKALTSTEIAGLDPASINSFDRPTTQKWSPKAADFSDYFLFGTAASPLLLIGDRRVRKDWLVVGVLGLETFVMNYGLTATFKGGFRRARPFVYNSDAPSIPKGINSARYSFFSGHASYSSALSFFAARVYLDYHPDSKIKPLIWGLATVLPATTAYLRVHAGKHFPTDVITGYVSGALIGYFIPVLHRKKTGDRKLSLLPQVGGSNGLQMVYRF